jgi:hypothetical protein
LPSVPAEATDAALAARSSLLADRPEPTVLSERRLTEIMLEAAAPAFAEEAAALILRHMERSTRYRNSRNRRGLLAYRRHFATAARVAAGAFSTDEDLKRAAAEALNRAYKERTEADD